MSFVTFAYTSPTRDLIIGLFSDTCCVFTVLSITSLFMFTLEEINKTALTLHRRQVRKKWKTFLHATTGQYC